MRLRDLGGLEHIYFLVGVVMKSRLAIVFIVHTPPQCLLQDSQVTWNKRAGSIGGRGGRPLCLYLSFLSALSIPDTILSRCVVWSRKQWIMGRPWIWSWIQHCVFISPLHITVNQPFAFFNAYCSGILSGKINAGKSSSSEDELCFEFQVFFTFGNICVDIQRYFEDRLHSKHWIHLYFIYIFSM